MLRRDLDDATRQTLQELVEANFARRDELYLAAEVLEDDDRRQVCRGLAEHLASHAIYLQQLLAMGGAHVPEPPSLEEMAAARFKRARRNGGSGAVLQVAEECERRLKGVYDRAIQTTSHGEATGILLRQRRQVEFGEQVLRSMRIAV